MAMNKYKSYKSCPIPRLKNIETPSLEIYPFASNIPYIKVKTLDTVFKIQTIGCYSFQGLHPVYFSFISIGAISLIN